MDDIDLSGTLSGSISDQMFGKVELTDTSNIERGEKVSSEKLSTNDSLNLQADVITDNILVQSLNQSINSNLDQTLEQSLEVSTIIFDLYSITDENQLSITEQFINADPFRDDIKVYISYIIEHGFFTAFRWLVKRLNIINDWYGLILEYIAIKNDLKNYMFLIYRGFSATSKTFLLLIKNRSKEILNYVHEMGDDMIPELLSNKELLLEYPLDIDDYDFIHKIFDIIDWDFIIDFEKEQIQEMVKLEKDIDSQVRKIIWLEHMKNLKV